MNYNSIIISSGGCCLKVKSSREIIKMLDEFDFIDRYIPNCVINYFSSLKVDDEILIDSQRDNSLNFEFTEGQAILSCELGKNVNLYDIVTVIEYYLEYIRQKNNIFCFHGSAVSYQGKGILLFGPMSGQGKTTLALNLCLRRGYKFIGDEKILVDKFLNIIGGTRHVFYNKPSLRKSIKENFHNLSEDELLSKVDLQNKSARIFAIVQPMLFMNVDMLEVEKWKREKINFHIYEELSRKIRGISRRIDKYSYPLQSIDCGNISSKRSKFAINLSKNVLAYTMWGGVDRIIDRINNFFISKKNK